ncbi:hypothetical protein GCM10009613_20670 [Pseudonocardia kongjuensis]|uniref:Uncharacterized protein n=1 Tax=Pseudonocardia kongjuensis TaxID=102227 RepID=A0ABN1XP00_9PSEU
MDPGDPVEPGVDLDPAARDREPGRHLGRRHPASVEVQPGVPAGADVDLDRPGRRAAVRAGMADLVEEPVQDLVAPQRAQPLAAHGAAGPSALPGGSGIGASR